MRTERNPAWIHKQICDVLTYVMQGCRSPLVVKLADSQKEKEMKRLQQMQAQLLNGAGAVGLGALSQQYLAVSITYTVSRINYSFVLMNLLRGAIRTGL